MTIVTTAQAHTVICSNCKSLPNKPCTQPTDTGRRAVSWVHLARIGDYREVLELRASLVD